MTKQQIINETNLILAMQGPSQALKKIKSYKLDKEELAEIFEEMESNQPFVIEGHFESLGREDDYGNNY